jgi:MFS superfamily sulfate permease-like transporter
VQGTDNLVATATTLTLMVGVMLLAARLLRLGFLVEGVSEVVLIGLKIGVGLSIAASQLPKLLGIPPPSTSGSFQDISNVLRNWATSASRRWPCRPARSPGSWCWRRWRPACRGR